MENLRIELDEKNPTQTPFPFTSRKRILLKFEDFAVWSVNR